MNVPSRLIMLNIMIKVAFILNGMILSKIIASDKYGDTLTIEDLKLRAERAANLSHLTGVSRKIQMYIKNRYLQILPNGTVNGSNDDMSDYTIFQRISVLRGQLKIQAIATCFYLCMNSSGLLYGSSVYTEDCLFNEILEEHNYNTYSSVHWSSHRKTLYLGLNRYGSPRRVQVKRNKLGRLSSYVRVLTRVVPIEKINTFYEKLHEKKPMNNSNNSNSNTNSDSHSNSTKTYGKSSHFNGKVHRHQDNHNGNMCTSSRVDGNGRRTKNKHKLHRRKRKILIITFNRNVVN